MNKHILIASAFVLSLVSHFSGAEQNKQNNKQKPNVIVILSDDQGYGDFSHHGNPILNTPNLDKLATDGIQLTDFHVDPTCSPSRASLMTGKFSPKVGVWLTFAGRNHLYKEEMTIAEVFKHNNYKTGIFGKWHLGDNYPFRPQDRGFDKSFIHGGGVAGEIPDYWDNDYFDDVYFDNGVPVQTQGYTTDIWFDQAKQFIKQSKDQPFFIYLATNTPHGPFNVAEKFYKPYLDKGLPETRARFYGMIETVDNNVGELRHFLEKNNLAENTLVIYMTDNGTSEGFSGDKNGYPDSGFNAGMRGRKTSAYEGGHRAASFWYWPKGKFVGNKVNNTLAAHIDILPTFIDLLDLEVPKSVDFDGQSLAKVLNSQPHSLDGRKLVIQNQARFGKPLGDGSLLKYKDYVVLQDKWRLVGDALFDLTADPSQEQDIAHKHPQKVTELKAFYESWWSNVSEHERLSPTVINAYKQKEVTLTAQAWSGDIATYDQSHVRAGIRNRGVWYIDVETSGHYQIEFSRWPKESNLAINDDYKKDFNDKKFDSNFRLYNLPPETLQVKSITMLLDKTKVSKTVDEKQKTVQFTSYLSKGLHKIEGVLDVEGMLNNRSSNLSAYYMYLNPIKID